MLDSWQSLDRCDKPRCRVVDGLVLGGRDVWVVVSRGTGDLDGLLAADGRPESDTRVCRAVLEGGILVLGHTSPERDPLLSTLLAGHDGA